MKAIKVLPIAVAILITINAFSQYQGVFSQLDVNNNNAKLNLNFSTPDFQSPLDGFNQIPDGFDINSFDALFGQNGSIFENIDPSTLVPYNPNGYNNNGNAWPGSYQDFFNGNNVIAISNQLNSQRGGEINWNLNNSTLFKMNYSHIPSPQLTLANETSNIPMQNFMNIYNTETGNGLFIGKEKTYYGPMDNLAYDDGTAEHMFNGDITVYDGSNAEISLITSSVIGGGFGPTSGSPSGGGNARINFGDASNNNYELKFTSAINNPYRDIFSIRNLTTGNAIHMDDNIMYFGNYGLATSFTIDAIDSFTETFLFKGMVGIGREIPNNFRFAVDGRSRFDQVSINTSTIPDDFRFAVNGKAVVEEMWVQNSSEWPDYVFKPEYELMPIENLENYINENNHLPNIPSAKEMENSMGINVGEMETKLLEKVEELTLYVIDIHKKVTALEDENKKLKEQLKVK